MSFAPRASDGPRVAEIGGDGVRGSLPEGDDALLAALAEDVHGLLLEVDVGEPQPDDLGGSQPARVRELEHRGVADAPAGRSPSAVARIASTSASFGASGSRRRRRGGSAIAGTRAAPRVKPMNDLTAARRRAIVDGASPRRPRPSSAVYSASACTSTSSSFRPVRSSQPPKSARSDA